MRTEHHRKVSRVGALVAALLAFVGVPWLLVAVSRWRLGAASPLDGLDPPWRWTLDGLRDWVDAARHGLSSTEQLINLFVRLATIVSWLCVAVLAVTVAVEVVHHLRFGLPSGRRRPMLGLGTAGRWIAAGLVGLLPAASPAAALSQGPAVRHAAAVHVQRLDPVATALPDLAPLGRASTAADQHSDGRGQTTHMVRPGESVWTIAELYASPDAVDEMAATIARLNAGRVMVDGSRFVTPALIEPGWELLLPDGVLSRSSTAAPTGTTTGAPSAAPTGAGAPAEVHIVSRGESYWRIADEHLEAASPNTEVSDREVLAYVDDLMAINVPRLGYDNPAMIHPGDEIFFEAGRSADESPAPLPPPVLAPPAPAPAPVFPVSVPPSSLPPEPVGAAPESPAPTSVTTPVDASIPSSAESSPESSPMPNATEPSVTTPSDGTAVPFVPPADDSGTQRHLPVGFVGGGLLAAGAVALVARRRRDALRRATVLQRVERRSDTVAANEALLRRCSDEERIVRLDLALRAAAADLADQQAHVTWVRLGWDGAITIGLDVPALPIAGSWKLGSERNTWVVPAAAATIDLAVDARRSAQPCPALVMLGTTDDAELYVDLEACGLLCLDGLPDLAMAVAATLALSPLAQPMVIETVGISEVESYTSSVHGAESLEAALDALDAHRSHLANLDGNSTMFRLRARRYAVGSSEPLVVIAVGVNEVDTLAPRLLALSRAGQGTAVVVDHAVAGARHVVRAELDGWCRLDSFNLMFRPIGLSAEQVATIGAVIDLEIVDDVRGDDAVDADVPMDDVADVTVVPSDAAPTVVGAELGGQPERAESPAFIDAESESPVDIQFQPAEAVPVEAAAAEAVPAERIVADRAGDGAGDGDGPDDIDGDDTEADEAERNHRLVVRLLGPVSVETTDGRPVQFERSKALELVVWMSQHRQRGLRAQARAALWDLDVRDATFANVVSDARRAMARAVPTGDDIEWIGRSIGDRLPLHDHVVTDAELLEAALRAVIARPNPTGWERLNVALSAVRGMPLSGTSYLWADGEGITSALILLATQAAVAAANHALECDDIDGVFLATRHGLSALPGHEELVALRMRAHAQRGDRAGVRQEWESYERAVRADPWSSGEPSPKLVDVRRELLGFEPRPGPGNGPV